ncbi:MAG: metal-dependent transcriptional regulator [Clostridiales bacterium]|nr:metal-dependent transcriptional regulator [Clostridiales bacterium]
MQIHESAENYLETILMIQKEKGYVRSIDVAHHLSFSKPSVSRAMTLLKTNGYIIMDPDGHLHLTESGQEIAERIYERHCLLSQWLTELGVDPEIAAEDACRIEHDISEVTFEKLKEHIRESHQSQPAAAE